MKKSLRTFVPLTFICFALNSAKSAEESCSAPILDKGYFLPVQKSYNHEDQIKYACDNGYKPAVEGWWATSTCQNGNWSHAPQCIGETFCFPLTIPNAKDIKTSSVFFENGHMIEITCNRGYVPKDQQNSAYCKNGKWISVPICEKSPRACSEPPNSPNSVIIHQKYQDVFDTGSEVEYQCKDGYVTEDKKTKKSITCNDGTWTEGSVCSETNGCDYVGMETGAGHETVMQWKITELWQDFCEMNTADYPDLENVGVKYIKNGETKELDCTNVHIFQNYSVVKCIDGKLHKTRCKYHFKINRSKQVSK
uniref:Sushi domain-containing protein n=1 Tax=Kryptolebias marmoratus TaxID=37003 RepID=A0A3Q2ZT35_KRYMA